MCHSLTALLWIVLWSAQAQDREVGALAPGPTELAESLAAIEAQTTRAEAIATAASRLQNAWAVGVVVPGLREPCADPAARSVAARLQLLGPAWRRAAQAARAEEDRLEVIVAAPTVAPLLDAATAERIAGLRARVAHQGRVYQEHVAWHRAHVVRARCAGTLATAPGIPLATPLPALEQHRPVAVGVAGGFACPGPVPAGEVAVLPEGLGCWSATPDCACEPQPMLPGAVLGPPAALLPPD